MLPRRLVVQPTVLVALLDEVAEGTAEGAVGVVEDEVGHGWGGTVGADEGYQNDDTVPHVESCDTAASFSAGRALERAHAAARGRYRPSVTWRPLVRTSPVPPTSTAWQAN